MDGFLILFLLLHTLSAGPLLAANWSDFTPLPVDLAIEAPGAGVAPGIASYSGVWQGRLRGC